MSEGNGARGRTRPAEQGRIARIRQWFQRAAGADGHERHSLALLGKATAAAVVAWVIAFDVMGATAPAFAPFSAVLMMQVTVYQSVVQALRYIGAVAAGVALQGALGFLGGGDLLVFALVTFAAIAIGRWRPLGAQGSQVPTAAFFAFSIFVSATGSAERWSQLGQIIVLVLIGCGVGVVVNLLVLPPMRYRSAESGIHTLASSMCDLVSDIYPALREEEFDEERTRHWRHRAAQLGVLIEQAQSSVQTARESLHYNPRRILQRNRRRASFAGYQAVIDALERVSYQLGSMTRSLDQSHDGQRSADHRDFLRRYGEFLAALAKVMDLLSHIDEDHLSEQARELCAAASDAQEQRTRLSRATEDSSLVLSDPSLPYGILLAEAVRLMDEIQHTCDVLQNAVDRVTGGAPGRGCEA